MNILMNVITYLSFVCLGWILAYLYFETKKKIAEQKAIEILTKPFNDLLTLFKSNIIIFDKRVNNIIYFISKDDRRFSVAFSLDKATISIFNGEDCIAVSASIDEKIKDALFSEMRKYSIEYNDVVMYGEHVVSKNVVTKQQTVKKEKKIQFNIDDILDKISKLGIEKLTPEEKKYLDNYGKK